MDPRILRCIPSPSIYFFELTRRPFIFDSVPHLLDVTGYGGIFPFAAILTPYRNRQGFFNPQYRYGYGRNRNRINTVNTVQCCPYSTARATTVFSPHKPTVRCACVMASESSTFHHMKFLRSPTSCHLPRVTASLHRSNPLPFCPITSSIVSSQNPAAGTLWIAHRHRLELSDAKGRQSTLAQDHVSLESYFIFRRAFFHS